MHPIKTNDFKLGILFKTEGNLTKLFQFNRTICNSVKSEQSGKSVNFFYCFLKKQTPKNIHFTHTHTHTHTKNQHITFVVCATFFNSFIQNKTLQQKKQKKTKAKKKHTHTHTHKKKIAKKKATN